MLGTVLDPSHTLFHLITQKSYKADIVLIFQVKKLILKEQLVVVEGMEKDLLPDSAHTRFIILCFLIFCLFHTVSHQLLEDLFFTPLIFFLSFFSLSLPSFFLSLSFSFSPALPLSPFLFLFLFL